MSKSTLKTFLTGTLAALGFALSAQADPLVVGGKNFTEQQLIAEITAQYLSAKGYEVDLRTGLGSAPLRQAHEAGQIDLYWEYTGTALINYNKVTERLSPDETYARVKALDAEKGLVWLDPSAVNNTYALAMRRAYADEHGYSSISDLAAAVNDGAEITFASNAEFYARADGLKPLQEAYGFAFPREDIKRMDSGLVYQALRDEQVDSGLTFSTDGRIKAFDFIVLQDDLLYFPAYAMTPVVREDTLTANPDLAAELNTLAAHLDNEKMATMNAEVDVAKTSVNDVAAAFLTAEGLI